MSEDKPTDDSSEKASDSPEEEWDIGISDEEAEEFEALVDQIDLKKLAAEAEEEENEG